MIIIRYLTAQVAGLWLVMTIRKLISGYMVTTVIFINVVLFIGVCSLSQSAVLELEKGYLLQ